MKNRSVLQGICLLFFTITFLAGCSSMNKARTLYANGNNQDALDMAINHLSADKEESIRIDAINLLGRIGVEDNSQLKIKSAKALMPLLDDSTSFVKTTVIKNLGILKYEPASLNLIKISLSADEDTLEEIGAAIETIGSKAIDLLVRTYLAEKNSANQETYKKVILLAGSDASKKLKEMSQ